MGNRTAIIIERADVSLGGAERSIFELSSALRAAGVEVDILAAKGQTKAKHIHTLCQDETGKRTPLLIFQKALEKYLAEHKYDIIHSTLPFLFADIYQPRGGAYPESILRNAASYQNRLTEFYKKTTAFANLRRMELCRAEKNLCEKSTGPLIAALSDYVAKQFKNHYGLADNRIIIIRNGVLVRSKVKKIEAYKLRTEVLTRLGLKEADGPVFFLFAANNFRLKGLSVLIHAMQMAAGNDSGHKGYLIVVGSDSTRKYKRLARRLNIYRKIVFLGAVRNIQNVLEISDVAVLPTFYDPSSRFILEALAADKPVITTKYNGATDLFVNNRHGRVIDIPENIPALAEALSYFTDTKNIYKASAAIIKDNVKEKISISNCAKQLRDLYESKLEQRAGK